MKLYIVSLLTAIALAEDSFEAILIKDIAGKEAVSGKVKFNAMKGDDIDVKVEISGLVPNSQHAIHIHAAPVTEGNCTTAGGHFNPTGAFHGDRTAKVRHAGDLGNVMADSKGRVKTKFKDSGFSLTFGNTKYVGGLAFVVHQMKDDLGLGGVVNSAIYTGNAGSRLACGNIRRKRKE